MKIDRFDEAIKNKVDHINYDTTDAEIEGIYDYVMAHNQPTFIQNVLSHKYKIITSMLVLSVFFNVWLWTVASKSSSKYELLTSKDKASAIHIQKPSIENNKRVEDKLYVANDTEVTSKDSTRFFDPKSSNQLNATNNALSIYKNHTNPIALKNQSNTMMVYDGKFSFTDHDAIAKSTAAKNESGQHIDDRASNEIGGKLEPMIEQISNSTSTSEAPMLLPRSNTKHLMTNNKPMPNIAIAIVPKQIQTIKPLDSYLKGHLGMNVIVSKEEIAYGLIGTYNLNPHISIFSSIQHSKGNTHHYNSVASYLDDNDENSSAKYNVDFADYNAVTDIREQSNGLHWTIGSQYKSKLWKGIDWISGVSATFRLAAESYLGFKYLPNSSLNYKYVHFDAKENDVDLQWISANLGISRKIRQFDIQLLYNASSDRINHRHHNKHIDVRSSAEVRLLYGF
jgi:hypothetical protein